MYKELLPNNCPPCDASEQDIILFRAFYNSDSNDLANYLSYAQLHTENEKYKNVCRAHGLSFFDTMETALLKTKKLDVHFIAKIQIKKDFGKLYLTNKNDGHYTLWLYNTFSSTNVKCLEINEIN